MKTNDSYAENLQRVPSSITVTVGNSLFMEDTWDLSPLVPQKAMKRSYKKVSFGYIRSPQMKDVVKLYAYHRLGQIKPQTLQHQINGYLPNFFEYCDLHGIQSFREITKDVFIDFSVWMRTTKTLDEKSGYLVARIVEDIVRVGQIKGWDVQTEITFTGTASTTLWRSGGIGEERKTQPIPEDIFNRIVDCAVNKEEDIITKTAIIIQSQTGLRISEVLSIQHGCLHTLDNGYCYMEVSLGKTVPGEPILHKVFANDLVQCAIKELDIATQQLQKESGLNELFLVRNRGIWVVKMDKFTSDRLPTFIRKWDIRDGTGNLYPLKSHQFRATFVRELIKKNIPLAYVMKQFSHVSIEMTSHYLSLQEEEVKAIYSKMILAPESHIAGLRAQEIKETLEDLFKGKTATDIQRIIDELADTMSFNPLPNGVCLYDYRRGNCTNGDGCFFYNCPNYITDVSFLPVLRKELDLMEVEMERSKELGMERQWQRRFTKYKYLKPLVESLEVQQREEKD